MKTDVTAWSLPARTPPGEIVVGRFPPAVAVLGVLAAVLYAVSFFLPALRGVLGHQAFVWSLLFVFYAPMWGANPALWFGLALLAQGKFRSARKAGVLALVLALSECWLFYRELRVGYFAWVGSMALLAVAGWRGARHEPPRELFLPRLRSTGEAGRIAARFAALRRRV
jgi:hypothetical protein